MFKWSVANASSVVTCGALLAIIYVRVEILMIGDKKIQHAGGYKYGPEEDKTDQAHVL